MIAHNSTDDARGRHIRYLMHFYFLPVFRPRRRAIAAASSLLLLLFSCLYTTTQAGVISKHDVHVRRTTQNQARVDNTVGGGERMMDYLAHTTTRLLTTTRTPPAGHDI